MDFKVERKGKKTLKNAADSRKTVTISLSTRDLANLDRLSETLHYSKSSILSALLEKASDPQDPKTFNAIANFFTDYEIARGQNVKKNKVSFNGPAAYLDNYVSGGNDGRAPNDNSTVLVDRTPSTETLASALLVGGYCHSGHYAKLNTETPSVTAFSHPDNSAVIFDTQGKSHKILLKEPFVISPLSVPLSVYDHINGQSSRATLEVIRQLAQKLIDHEAEVVLEADDNGLLRFTGISMAAPSGSGAKNAYKVTDEDVGNFWDLDTGKRFKDESQKARNAFLSENDNFFDSFYSHVIDGLTGTFAMGLEETREAAEAYRPLFEKEQKEMRDVYASMGIDYDKMDPSDWVKGIN